jgi:hypothetical protein
LGGASALRDGGLAVRDGGFAARAAGLEERDGGFTARAAGLDERAGGFTGRGGCLATGAERTATRPRALTAFTARGFGLRALDAERRGIVDDFGIVQ